MVALNDASCAWSAPASPLDSHNLATANPGPFTVSLDDEKRLLHKTITVSSNRHAAAAPVVPEMFAALLSSLS